MSMLVFPSSSIFHHCHFRSSMATQHAVNAKAVDCRVPEERSWSPQGVAKSGRDIPCWRYFEFTGLIVVFVDAYVCDSRDVAMPLVPCAGVVEARKMQRRIRLECGEAVCCRMSPRQDLLCLHPSHPRVIFSRILLITSSNDIVNSSPSTSEGQQVAPSDSASGMTCDFCTRMDSMFI